jgi:hypothetical protein
MHLALRVVNYVGRPLRRQNPSLWEACLLPPACKTPTCGLICTDYQLMGVMFLRGCRGIEDVGQDHPSTP